MNTETQVNREIRETREQRKKRGNSYSFDRFSCSRISRGSRLVPIRSWHAFTLIELLVVITIIGILAGLLVGLAGAAGDKKKRALVEAEKNKLMSAIEAYHDKLGFYPPDNPNNPAQNQLFYELTAARAADNNGTAYHDFRGLIVTSGDLSTCFNKGGIANSGPQAFAAYGAEPKPSQYAAIPGHTNVFGLLVPVDYQGNQTNFWCYDASSTNRHNPDSYDLWAVFSVGKNIVTNGNWPQQ